MVTDLCDPLVAFVLGQHSSADRLFQGSLQDGLHKRDYTRPWGIARQPTGEMVVVGKKETDPIELDNQKSPSLRARLLRFTHIK
jgi:hypothetical protein